MTFHQVIFLKRRLVFYSLPPASHRSRHSFPTRIPVGPFAHGMRRRSDSCGAPPAAFEEKRPWRFWLRPDWGHLAGAAEGGSSVCSQVSFCLVEPGMCALHMTTPSGRLLVSVFRPSE